MKSMQPNTRRRALVTAVTLAPLAGLPSAVSAQALVSSMKVEDFFRNPVLSGARLSPDGRLVAGTRITAKGRANIVVVDVATRKVKIITDFTDGDVGRLGWVNNTRLFFSISDRQRGADQLGATGLFAIDADASGFVTLAERAFMTEGGKLLPVGSTVHSRVVENGELTDDIRVVAYSYQAKGKSSSTMYRVNTRTGRFSPMTVGGPGNAQQWLIDSKGVPRCCVSYTDETFTVHFRAAEDAPWTAIYSYRDDDTAEAIKPQSIAPDGRIYVVANNGNDTSGLYAFDPKTRKLDPTPVFAVKGFDADDIDLLWDRSEGKLLGISYEAIEPGTYWIDEERAALQATVDKALPETVNAIQVGGAGDDRVVLISSSSDRDPGRYYLYQVKQDKFQGLGATRPWVKVPEMRPTTFFRYTARDGMQIPAQLTMPAGDGKPPLIVLHYGGPWVRPIHMHWDPVVQFLASRGYAVFMPAPRASTGFGDKLFRAGWKQWGLAMQDDVTDGVRLLIQQGKVDPKRVCIAGASYGGYLTMMGLAKEPELFRCGINWVGVTDPNFMFTVTWTDFNRYGGPDTGRRRLIGDPEKDAEQFKQTSPLQRAAEIKQPVLMGYGALDVRVPLINGEKMRDALKGHNKNVEWVVYSDEAHGWRREANNVDFWTRVERFLAKNLA
jgi:dipeptidyl aminopeptidase/acylaminoacyl peptidase